MPCGTKSFRRKKDENKFTSILIRMNFPNLVCNHVGTQHKKSVIGLPGRGYWCVVHRKRGCESRIMLNGSFWKTDAALFQCLVPTFMYVSVLVFLLVEACKYVCIDTHVYIYTNIDIYAFSSFEFLYYTAQVCLCITSTSEV